MEQEIIEFLKQKYDAEAIVLHGSRAGGYESETSDWDLFVFTKKEIEGEIDKLNNQHIDVDIIKIPFKDDLILKTFAGPLEYSKVIYDPNNITSQVIKRTKQARIDGPDKMNANLYKSKKLVTEKLVLRIEKYKDNSMKQFYYLGYFYEVVIKYWYQLRQEWPLSPYRAIDDIKNKDESFYNYLERLVSDNDKIVPAKEIYKKLFNNK